MSSPYTLLVVDVLMCGAASEQVVRIRRTDECTVMLITLVEYDTAAVLERRTE